MKKLLLLVAFAVAGVLVSVVPASGAGEVCYDIQVSPDPAGISQSGCQTIPDAPLP